MLTVHCSERPGVVMAPALFIFHSAFLILRCLRLPQNEYLLGPNFAAQYNVIYYHEHAPRQPDITSELFENLRPAASRPRRTLNSSYSAFRAVEFPQASAIA